MNKQKIIERAQKAIKEGRVVISNDAAMKGGRSVTVKAGHRLGTIVFEWSRPGIGFGALVMRVGANGTLEVDRESMNVEFCVDVVRQALQEATDL